MFSNLIPVPTYYSILPFTSALSVAALRSYARQTFPVPSQPAFTSPLPSALFPPRRAFHNVHLSLPLLSHSSLRPSAVPLYISLFPLSLSAISLVPSLSSFLWNDPFLFIIILLSHSSFLSLPLLSAASAASQFVSSL